VYRSPLDNAEIDPGARGGHADRLWSVGDIVDLIEASEELEDGSPMVG
jgi:hypothetical protein